MNKICTSIKQSKKLRELGIDVNTADMCYIKDKPNIGFLYKEYKEFGDTILQDYYPAWSLSALLDIIPKHIGDSVFRMDMGETDINLWFDDLSSRTVDENLPDIIKENFVDAAFEMVVRLKENGKI